MGWEMADENASQIPEQPTKRKRRQKPKKKHGVLFKIFIVLAALVAIALIGTEVSNLQKENATFTWPTSGMATLLPQPASDKGSIDENDDDDFRVSVNRMSETDYADYAAACKGKGFTVEAESSSYGYDAFNEEGYKLSLSYWSSSSQLTIKLEAPLTMTALTWPAQGVGALVPTPDATQGKVVTDSSRRYDVYVGGMGTDKMNAYIDACIAAGYDVDYNRSEDGYEAKMPMAPTCLSTMRGRRRRADKRHGTARGRLGRAGRKPEDRKRGRRNRRAG